MNDDARVWQLADGEGLLADLVVTGGDFPWLNAEVRPTGRFERIRPLFEEELRRLDRLDDDPASWEAAYHRVRQAVRLLAPDGRPVPEFLLTSTATTPGGDGVTNPSPTQRRNSTNWTHIYRYASMSVSAPR